MAVLRANSGLFFLYLLQNRPVRRNKGIIGPYFPEIRKFRPFRASLHQNKDKKVPYFTAFV